jgi:hypothetical protein
MANPHTDKHRFNHGAHGEHFFKDLLLGTTAEKVVPKETVRCWSSSESLKVRIAAYWCQWTSRKVITQR